MICISGILSLPYCNQFPFPLVPTRVCDILPLLPFLACFLAKSGLHLLHGLLQSGCSPLLHSHLLHPQKGSMWISYNSLVSLCPMPTPLLGLMESRQPKISFSLHMSTHLNPATPSKSTSLCYLPKELFPILLKHQHMSRFFA